MFLLYFRSENKALKINNAKIIKKNNNYYTITCSNEKDLNLLKKQINIPISTNIFNNLIDDYICISPINIYKNNIQYDNIYNKSKQIFIKEIINDLNKSNIINFYNNDIINIDQESITFKKTIFLQNWNFLIELNNILKKKFNKTIKFKKINKFVWKKKITLLDSEAILPDHNK